MPRLPASQRRPVARPETTGRVTRFQVMAVLQTARARAFGLDNSEAKSWGLNRAMFYAAAKRSWADAKAIGLRRPVIAEFERAKVFRDKPYTLGGEKSFVATGPEFSGRGLLFKFGDRVQRPLDFDRQVKSRFADWETAWDEAVKIIKSANPRDLQSQSRFFDHVYKPRRDELAERWSRLKARQVRGKPRPVRAKKAASRRRAA